MTKEAVERLVIQKVKYPQAYEDLADRFRSGHALSLSDVVSLMVSHGYSQNGAGMNFDFTLDSGRFEKRTGVEVVSETVEGKRVYRSASIPREQTDIEDLTRRLRDRSNKRNRRR